ncbi:polysaccharide deacetylase family protein [Polyangium jinanense]|uniref:polysaccharide deacetylase family protein n=1 Tax=Polyangium jinanense TaxID=2829994 RepID=UPI002340D70D|nr:polysaccharide deacetylase family protein [Polyangium jinanense]MDC3957525.1 polysaccharide deacetylase family protein [Polyangium jinanense]
MSNRRLFGATAIALFHTFAAGCGDSPREKDDAAEGAQAVAVARPPQFVILAFDGSYNLSFWRESRAFAAANKLKFTYFISGVYFIPNAAKLRYNAPRHGPGKSAIGWGGTVDEIAERFEEVKKAAAEGHEIASHANGHFDGSSWSEADWESEFDQFEEIIFRGIGLSAPELGFGPRDVVGFRAPLLAHSPGLFKTLVNKGYTYDTSRTNAANYWPEKIAGIWNFPLAELRIVGSGKATLSMDYNFYFADSGAKPDPDHKETYKKQMVDTYMAYFESNYFGNRAPLHIGHHFSKWNGGAYWEAMQAFAQAVCGLPEVTCGTYKDLVKFVEEHEDERRDLQAGNFAPLSEND